MPTSVDQTSFVSQPTPTLDYEALLRSGIQAARRGQTTTARAIFRAILHEHPTEVRAWLALAGVAATREEQQDALEQVLRIDPANAMAQRALQRLQAVPPAVSPTSVTPASYTDELDQPVPLSEPPAATDELSETSDDEAEKAPAPFSRVPGWLVIALLAAALGLALGYFLLPLFSSQNQARPVATATPALAISTQPVIAPTQPAPTAFSTTQPVQQATLPVGIEPTAPGIRPATPTPVLVAPPVPLAMGTLQEHDGWSATLLRPDYALSLDGPIGDLRPNGRFVLALLSVSNGATAPRRMPNDLFVLIDQQGRSYTPSAGTSTAYLSIFGRGQYGDLAVEDEVAPGGSLFSIPVIFDVPLDANGFLLTMAGNRSAGWQVLEGAAAPQNVNTGP
jgi:hypothetical protein